MFRVFRLVVCCVLLNGFAATITHAAEPAELSMYLFQDGAPQGGIDLLINGDKRLQSSEAGSIITSLEPGQYQFILQKNGQQLHTFELSVHEKEIVQAIITLYESGKVARVDIESSKSGDNAEAGDATAVVIADDLPAGVLIGLITSAENGKPVTAARILVSGLSDEIVTDDTGQYQIEVPPGSYSVSVLMNGFNSLTREKVTVASKETTSLDIALSPSGMELPEFVVLEPHIAGSLASVLSEQKTTSAIASVLGAEQISRSGDSNAASALRRATGLTVVDGKFVYVRGLGERFSSTLLNGARIPSPDPTRRVIALDLFPASILDSVLVQKSYSPNMPGEFSGGVVEIRTKTIPDDFFARVSLSSTFNDTTTGEKGLHYKGGDYDFFGVDDGTRDMPDSLHRAVKNGERLKVQGRFDTEGFSSEEIAKIGADLSDVWDVDQKTIAPDGKAIFSLGDVFQAGDFSFGYTGSARWDQSWDTREEVRKSVSAFKRGDDTILSIESDRDLVTTKRQVQTNLYLSTEINYDDLHRIYATGLLVRQSEDETRLTQGFEANYRDDLDVRRARLEYEETSLLTQQYGGEHTFSWLNDLGIDWLYSVSKAKRKAPNEKNYRLDENRDGDFELSGFSDSNRVSFSNLTDHDETIRFDLDLPIQPLNALSMHLKSGYYLRKKDRTSDIRRFQFSSGITRGTAANDLNNSSLEVVFSDENLLSNVIDVAETTAATDNYSADQTLQAYYGQIEMDIFEFLNISGGVRIEDNEQSVQTFDLFNPAISKTSTLESVDLLPAVAVTLKFNEKLQLRASYSETLSRPDFRELSSAFYRDPLTDELIQGREDLEQSTINNYDVRWEYYLSDNESISAAFFWKDIQSPIEKVGLAGANAPRQLQNTESATVYGVEAEIFKNLDFIHEYLENFYIAANYTWTRSNTVLAQENLDVLTTNNRPLQGHSPYIINVQFGYDNEDWGTTATILFNTYGERISELGRSNAPDIIEQPFKQLDFVYRQHLWEGFNMTFKAINLLDDTFQIKQGDVTTRSFKKNREFSLGLNYNF